jgi:O-antigen chain-terminating methyltransferase
MTRDEPQPESPLDNAAAHADLGLPFPKGTRLRAFKVLVERIARIFTGHQRAFNHATLDALRGQEETLARIELRTIELTARIDGMRAELDQAIESVRSDQRRELGRWRSDHALVERMLHELRAGRAPLEVATSMSGDAASAVDPGASDDLYEEFEDLHRGSDELVRSRLTAYVPELRKVAGLGRVLDVGTGRGEFLEVLAEAGIDGYGVDTNATAVERSRAKGLEVVHADALDHLAELPPASLAAVTAFHVVEHLPFERLIALIDHATRVLQPGGLLVLETPNPTNLVVGASSFYLDPTHRRPVPPPLLHFALWSRGYDPIEVRYLNPPPEQLEAPADLGADRRQWEAVFDRLNELLFGPNDYCVIGHRVGPEN